MSTDLKDITIYYNTFNVSKKNSNGKNPTDYVDMYDMPEFKNSLFIYTANETNSGPGNTKYNGGGTALVAKKERAFGIITGCLHLDNCKTYGITTTYKVIYQFNNKAQKYITNKPTNTEQKTVLNHIADQITMLGKFIIGWNNDSNQINKITNIILPLKQETGGELKLGVDLFSNYNEIYTIGDYWLNSVLKLFNKTNNNLKPALNLLKHKHGVTTQIGLNPNAKPFKPKTFKPPNAAGEAATATTVAAAIIGERDGWWSTSRNATTVEAPQKKTKKAAKKAPTEEAKKNLKQLLQDDTDLNQAYELFNELITLLNKNDTTLTNILELKNKDDNNTLFQLKKTIISVKPFSTTKSKETCTFNTLFDILTDKRKKDNICTSVNLTNLQASVYHFNQLINNFHKYIDDKYIKIENGNIVITKDAIVKYFDKKQSESRNTNLINIYKALSQNINFSLNINMFNILKIKYLRPFFNTVINTKYFTLLQADNDIYKLYNSVITHKHNTKLGNIKNFKYLYSIVDLINKNDNIKNSIINKYNSPSEPRRPESTRSAEPEAPRSARREYVPLNTDTKKKLKKKIAFVNI